MRTDFKLALIDRLGLELPGSNAHQRLMPERVPIEAIDYQRLNPKQSAVLLLIYPKAAQWHTVFIQRPLYDGVHSGQIALPGGKYEKEDPDLSHTALREAEEELAIPSQEVELVGRLTPLYVPPSNYLIEPYVGFHQGGINFKPDPVEVHRYIESDLNLFLNYRKSLQEQMIKAGDYQRRAKGYPLDGEFLWGATAMMMTEFAEILEELH